MSEGGRRGFRMCDSWRCEGAKVMNLSGTSPEPLRNHSGTSLNPLQFTVNKEREHLLFDERVVGTWGRGFGGIAGGSQVWFRLIVSMPIGWSAGGAEWCGAAQNTGVRRVVVLTN